MADPRQIPSIDNLCGRPGIAALEARYGRRAVVDALRAGAQTVRTALAGGADYDDIAGAIETWAATTLEQSFAPSLRPLINATGVVIHTNLGRAPLARHAIERIIEAASGYCNLEYDLESGTRGRRDVHAERAICRLLGAERACVVNNNAAATLITLAALSAGREVLVSRGELVEIGGGFRVPDVMAQSGATLREVGTTNRTRVADYAAAIGDRTALILRVHPSNFRIEGFTERPALRDLVELGSRFGVPVVDDLGSGYVGAAHAATAQGAARHDWTSALRDEPSVEGALADGAAVVMFSGDKLLGGPQAGIIAGRKDAIERIRRHPLMRAVRVDKLTYAALDATLNSYVVGTPGDIPVVRMLALPKEAVRIRAEALARVLRGPLQADIIDGESTIGGGSAPGATLPTSLLRLKHPALSAHTLEAALRAQNPPVIARIQDDRVVLDLRTVLPEHDAQLTLLLQSLPVSPQ